jgi:hypothetical protein
MSESQQTAVGWIEHNIQSDMNFIEIMGLIRQAKAMEKEQITFAYNDGADAMVAGKYKSMEDYYNELYQSRQDKADK